ncbi:hypothetical protein FQA39_LY00541 [Lamprigera yunnana]|nr:hypothetical protein FQA39_LY00541 [Lamprigera yunnana]
MAEDVSCRRPCNARLDVLSKPTKRRVLHLWKNYISLFSEGRKETIRLLLQELYAMTPEETQKYFDEISAVIKKLAARKKLRARMAKQYHIKLRRFERKRALRLFRRVFIRALTYACKNPVPPLVTPRLRYMSDLILEQLCDIRGVNVPQRTDCGSKN